MFVIQVDYFTIDSYFCTDIIITSVDVVSETNILLIRLITNNSFVHHHNISYTGCKFNF